MQINLIFWPSRDLRRVCEPVEEFGDALKDLAGRMALIVESTEALGLSAPQIGRGERLIVMRVPGDAGDETIALVNPVVVDSSGESTEREGSLSIPGVSAKVSRPSSVTVWAADLDGRRVGITATDVQAHVLQHQIDLLDGILFTDKVSSSRKAGVKKQLRLLRGIPRDNSRKT